MIKELQKKLKMLRINNELTRKQVSELIGISESSIGLYESGNRQPSLSVLIKLAGIYKVTTDYLLGCEMLDKSSLSLHGLTNEQIRALYLTVQCFRTSLNE